MMRQSRPILGVLVLGLAGCGSSGLNPTPNLYLMSAENPFADVPPVFQNNQVDVLYVTDRKREDDEKTGEIHYGYGRSDSMAFGSAVIQFGGEEVSWDQIVQASRGAERDVELPVELVSVEEKGRFPSTPWPYDLENEVDDGRIVFEPETVAEHERVSEAFLDDVRARLAKTPKKEAFVFIHGYNNGFEHATSVIAQIWHFLPRQGVPIVYTWPAGKGGLRGYFYDRESGEFTIYHLKDFLRLLSDCEELEKIHLIAHSRGTDVLMTALRELLIEAGGRDWVPPEDRKLGHVIVAAPDLDMEVITQRVAAEEVAAKIDSLTVYMSKSDAAIGLSTWLFVSQKRIGRVTEEDFTGKSLARAASVHQKGLALVNAEVDTGFIGHSYFYSHPAVLSDLILILRDGRPPGVEHGRPLIKHVGSFWTITDGYPNEVHEEEGAASP